MSTVLEVTMKSQWGPGKGGFVDLNCGWYCEVAALTYWAERRLGKKMPANPRDLLPCSKLSHGFRPGSDDDRRLAVATRQKPQTALEWERFLLNNGAGIVGGKLGGADWGRFFKGGIGHMVVIVGVDTHTNELLYKDPLQGNSLKKGAFSHVNPRIDSVYYVNGSKLTLDLNDLAVPSIPGRTRLS
jgi:hypothetical protein